MAIKLQSQASMFVFVFLFIYFSLYVSGQSDLECVATSPDREIFMYIDLAYLNRGYTDIIYLAIGSL